MRATLGALVFVASTSACFADTTVVVIDRPPAEEVPAIEAISQKLGWNVTRRDATSICLDSGWDYGRVICFSPTPDGRTQAACVQKPPEHKCRLAIDDATKAASWHPIE